MNSCNLSAVWRGSLCCLGALTLPSLPAHLLQKASRAEWDSVLGAQQGSGGIVKLKGLPIKATAADVVAFFQVASAPHSC
jgi:hypothetical protein